MSPTVNNLDSVSLLETYCIQYQYIRQSKKHKKMKISSQLYFHRKCVFLWNRYLALKVVQPQTHNFYSFTLKQFTTPLSQKICLFVQSVPGTAILHIEFFSGTSESIQCGMCNPTLYVISYFRTSISLLFSFQLRCEPLLKLYHRRLFLFFPTACPSKPPTAPQA